MTRKTRRSRGTIESRGRDRWLVRVSLGRDPVSGKWIRLSKLVTGSKREAERFLTELLGKQDRGAPLPRTRLTLHAWLAEYAATWSGHLSARTRETDAESIRLYLTPALRSLPLARLTPRAFQDRYNELHESGKAPATVNRLHRVLRTRLNKAVALGYLAANPLAAVRAPAPKHREYRVLSPEEARLFLQEAEHDTHGALWIVLLMTGLRPEEALGLKWEDLDGAKLRVRRALVRLAKGKWELAGTKTRRERTVTLPSVALKALTRHRARQAEAKLLLGSEYKGQGLVFAAALGQPLHWDNLVRRHFRPVIERVAFQLLGREPVEVTRRGTKRAELSQAFEAARKAARNALRETGLDRMRPYDLRHSAATLLLAAGEHPKVVAERLGHSKVTLTLDTYSHVVPGLEERAAERLAAVIHGHAAVVAAT